MSTHDSESIEYLQSRGVAREAAFFLPHHRVAVCAYAHV